MIFLDCYRCMYVLLIMGVSWLLELLPIPATALIPVVAFPPLGILYNLYLLQL